MRRSSRLVLGVAAFAILAGTPAAFAQQNYQSLVQKYYQDQQKEQQALQQAVQKRNDAMVKQYQAAMKKRQDAYKKQMDEFVKNGGTAEQLVQMQRDAILAQIPKSSQSAMKRKWAREDRIRQIAIDRAKRTGKAPERAGGSDEIGGGIDLDLGSPPKAESEKAE